MKKILILGLSVVLLTVTATAQRGPGDLVRNERITDGIENGHITRAERFRLRRDELRYKMEQRNARRDGFVSPRERRRLHKMRRHERREMFRLRHNGRHRVI